MDLPWMWDKTECKKILPDQNFVRLHWMQIWVPVGTISRKKQILKLNLSLTPIADRIKADLFAGGSGNS